METRTGGLWARGGIIFAGVTMILIGAFGALQGLAAIVKDAFFVVTPNYYITVDVTTWGWIHLILGVVVVLAGCAVFTASTWARVVGITIAVLSGIANFMFIPYYPVWSLLIIALDVFVIWALATYSREAVVEEPTVFTTKTSESSSPDRELEPSAR
jgi:hypothetical protein